MVRKLQEGCDAGPQQNDLVRTGAFLLIWGVPGALVFFANVAWHVHWLSFVATGALMTAAITWIGVACYINGRRSGRAHCMIDGYLLPLLSIVGVLNMLRVTSISWQTYMDIFWLTVAVSFVPEWVGLRYLQRGLRELSGNQDGSGLHR